MKTNHCNEGRVTSSRVRVGAEEGKGPLGPTVGSVPWTPPRPQSDHTAPAKGLVPNSVASCCLVFLENGLPGSRLGPFPSLSRRCCGHCRYQSGRGWEPVPVACQQSFGLAACLQGLVRSQGTSGPCAQDCGISQGCGTFSAVFEQPGRLSSKDPSSV